MGFTKLDSGIVDSSVWAEPLATRVVWVTFLAKADYQGIVRASHSGMLRAANVEPADFDKALQTLESPDPDSRSPEYEGRRIEKIEGGWKVLNYQKYREYTYSNSPGAIRVRRHREKRYGALHVTKGRYISASASASALSIEQEREIRGAALELIPERDVDGRVLPAVHAFQAEFNLRDPVETFKKKASWWRDNPAALRGNISLQLRNWWRIEAEMEQRDRAHLEVGRSICPLSTEGKEYTAARKVKVEELYKETEFRVKAARQAGDVKELARIGEEIKEALAKFSQEWHESRERKPAL